MVGEARRTRIGGGGECRRRRSGGGRWGGDIGTTLLMLAWLGAPHSILFLLIASLLFLSFPSAIMVLVFLFVLMLLPIDQNSKLGLTLARQICKTACAYFPIHFYVEDADAFHPNLPYIFGYEPHSIWPVGIITLSSLSGLLPLPNIRGLVSNAMLKTPVMRHVWTWLGFTPATKQNFKSLLSSGYSCILIPGGAQETFYTQRGSETLFLKSRKGFVRIAMEMGAPLVPVFGFGQSNVYQWWKPSSKLYLKLSRALKFTPVFFWGYLGSFVPFQHPIYVVVGTPIQVENNPNPSEEEVAELHGRFIEALRELFEKHKERAGCVHHRLQIL